MITSPHRPRRVHNPSSGPRNALRRRSVVQTASGSKNAPIGAFSLGVPSILKDRPVPSTTGIYDAGNGVGRAKRLRRAARHRAEAARLSADAQSYHSSSGKVTVPETFGATMGLAETDFVAMDVGVPSPCGYLVEVM